ncbi:hypothetical protein D1P53_000952 [Cryptococcus gattii VGV]|nr:hypothetical protein D1P53_000952 [Cryptococcus gattii VGV]
MPFTSYSYVPERIYNRRRTQSGTSNNSIPTTPITRRSTKRSDDSTAPYSDRRRRQYRPTESSSPPSDQSTSDPITRPSTLASSEDVEKDTGNLRDIEETMKSTKLDDAPETEVTAVPPSPPTDAITELPATEGEASQASTETNPTETLPSMNDTQDGPPAEERRQPDIDWDAIDRVQRRKEEATATRSSRTRSTNGSAVKFWLLGGTPKAPPRGESKTSHSKLSKAGGVSSTEGTEAGTDVKTKSRGDPILNKQGKKRADTFPLDRKSHTTKASSSAKEKSRRETVPLKRRETAPPTISTSRSRRTDTVSSFKSSSSLGRTISLSIGGQTLDDLLGGPPKPRRRTDSGFSLFAKPKKAESSQSKSWVTKVTIPKEDDDLPLLSWMQKGGFSWPSEQPEDWDPVKEAPRGVEFDKMDDSKRLSRLWPDDRNDMKRWAWGKFIDYRQEFDQYRAKEAVAESSKGRGDDIQPAAPEPPRGE